MLEQPRGAVQHLFRELYRPFEGVPELVRCFCEATLAVTESHRVEIVLPALKGTSGFQVSAKDDGLPRHLSSSRSSRFPIRYQTSDLGFLELFPSVSRRGNSGTEACEWIAKTLAYHLKRHEASRLARERHHREVVLIGTSEPLAQVDRFLERASQTTLPALIIGSRGSGVEEVALALHLMGPAPGEPFVQVNCAIFNGGSFEQQLLGLLSNADHGTLLLAHLEDLDFQSQSLLCHVLEIGLVPWAVRKCGQAFAVRLLTTAHRDLEQAVRDGEFSLPLLDQLDFLRLVVKPLRNRREDIRPLLEYYLRRYACSGVPEISFEVLEACIEYDWPGDLSELARVMARLAVMTEDGRVLPVHVQAHAPQILEPRVRPPDANPGRPSGDDTPSTVLAEGFLPLPETRHPGLRKAIGYISDNFQRKLPLTEVASKAYVSTSHLAYLFHRELGTSFVRFLTALRLERAKRLLREQPWDTIAVIATHTGFSDLRHFERAFKGVVGCSPKKFRKMHREAAAANPIVDSVASALGSAGNIGTAAVSPKDRNP